MSASGIPKEEAELIERFKSFVEQEARLQQAKFHAFSAERAQQVQAEFWAKMKAVLCVNKFSENLEVLDYVAAAIINGSPDPEQAFCRPVMILPRPERQRFGVESTAAALTEQKSEAPPAKRNSPPSSHASEGEAVLSKKAKTVACTMNTLRSTEAKELPTAGGVSGRIGQTGGTVVNAAATPELKLSAKTPVTVLGDLQQMYHEANAQGVFPYEKAYPWEGVYLWYDPADYEDVYLAHWRFWNLHRPVFFDWALHVPHASGAMLAARRKKKMAAGRARQEFVSLCIERWGWYGFLRMLEFTGNRHLMWWGGQPGRNSSKGKAYTGGHVVDLGELCKKDEGAYKAKIAGALKPFRLDEGAFANLPELLEQTDALDPSLVPYDQRLSDRALARIRQDVTSQRTAQPHWKGDLSTGVWHKLCADPYIEQVQLEISSLSPESTPVGSTTVPAFDAKETKTVGWTAYKLVDGSPSALAPRVKVPLQEEGYFLNDGDEEEEKGE